MFDKKTLDKAVCQHEVKHRKARTAEACRHVQKQLEEIAASYCRQAERDYGCLPLRVNLRVTEKKPKAYYEAAEMATGILLRKPYLGDMKIKDLLPVLFAEVRERLKIDETVISSEESYWKAPFNDIQRETVHGMLRRSGYEPSKCEDRLSAVLKLLRAGRPATASNERPVGRNTSQGQVSFESRNHIHYLGERYLIRWKNKKPYLRMGGSTEHNLFSLLTPLGIDQATAELWMTNAEHDAANRREQGRAAEQHIADTAQLEACAGELFDTSPPPRRTNEDDEAGERWSRLKVTGDVVDA